MPSLPMPSSPQAHKEMAERKCVKSGRNFYSWRTVSILILCIMLLVCLVGLVGLVCIVGLVGCNVQCAIMCNVQLYEMCNCA